MTSCNVLEKYVELSAENTNVNFESFKRTGKNNVYEKLTDASFTAIFGVGCVAHKINKYIQNVSDLLPINLEVIVVKIANIFISR